MLRERVEPFGTRGALVATLRVEGARHDGRQQVLAFGEARHPSVLGLLVRLGGGAPPAAQPEEEAGGARAEPEEGEQHDGHDDEVHLGALGAGALGTAALGRAAAEAVARGARLAERGVAADPARGAHVGRRAPVGAVERVAVARGVVELGASESQVGALNPAIVRPGRAVESRLAALVERGESARGSLWAEVEVLRTTPVAGCGRAPLPKGALDALSGGAWLCSTLRRHTLESGGAGGSVP
eukprot:scaffold165979_cov27-Tisochrysis_lutea.AAC.1